VDSTGNSMAPTAILRNIPKEIGLEM